MVTGDWPETGFEEITPRFPPRRLPGPVMDGEPQNHISKRYAVSEDLSNFYFPSHHSGFESLASGNTALIGTPNLSAKPAFPFQNAKSQNRTMVKVPGGLLRDFQGDWAGRRIA